MSDTIFTFGRTDKQYESKRSFSTKKAKYICKSHSKAGYVGTRQWKKIYPDSVDYVIRENVWIMP